MKENKNNEWFIDQYNRNRSSKDQIKTIKELKRKKFQDGESLN